MRRSSVLLLVLTVLITNRVSAQQPLSDEEKKRLFLKAREEMTTIPWTPPANADAPAPKPKPKPKPPTDNEPVAPKIAPPTPKPFEPREMTPPVVRPPTPAPTPFPPRAPITELPPQETPFRVEKSAVGQVDDDEPPKEESRGFFSRIFGGGTSYKYVTGPVKRAISNAPVRKGRWRYIVVHNSGTRQGSAAAFENYHRYVRKMSNGMAYHFVIGNGTSTGDGKIEVGNRWHRQIQGGHVHSDYLNNISVGICLVGDFNNHRPTSAQLASLEELIKVVRDRVGRVNGQKAVVQPHRNINPPRWPTDCPGDEFPYSFLRRF
ncbi:MAG: hypothetical protein RL088_3649 [Verrucomicrobiota bacterium]